jgi:hypothetical protein
MQKTNLPNNSYFNQVQIANHTPGGGAGSGTHPPHPANDPALSRRNSTSTSLPPQQPSSPTMAALKIYSRSSSPDPTERLDVSTVSASTGPFILETFRGGTRPIANEVLRKARQAGPRPKLTPEQKSAEMIEIREALREAAREGYHGIPKNDAGEHGLKKNAYFIAIVNEKYRPKPAWPWALGSMEKEAGIKSGTAGRLHSLHKPMTEVERRLERALNDGAPSGSEETSEQKFHRGMNLGDLPAIDKLPAVAASAWDWRELSKLTGFNWSAAVDKWELHHADPDEVDTIRKALDNDCKGLHSTDKYRKALEWNRLRHPPLKRLATPSLRVFANNINRSFASTLKTKKQTADQRPDRGNSSQTGPA